MKNKLLVFGAIVCLAAILAAGTLAYFTDDVVTHNVITSDAIDVEIIEKTEDENGKEIPWPEETGLSGIYPDTEVVKKVHIENRTAQSAWIMVKLKAEIIGADGKKLPDSVIRYPIASDKWKQYPDGNYYYTEAVPGYGKTELLLEKVEFVPEMGNEYQNAKVVLTVDAYAVQEKNNPLPESGDHSEIPGWPEN